MCSDRPDGVSAGGGEERLLNSSIRCVLPILPVGEICHAATSTSDLTDPLESGQPPIASFKPPLIRRRQMEMQEVPTDGFVSEHWTEEDLELLKCLVDLKIPIDVISEELERPLTATSLKAVELKLNWFS